MAKKKTQEEFEKELHEKFPQIKILGKYKGSCERVSVKCSIDEYEWDALPNNLRAYGCPVCNGGIITTQSFKNEIKKLHPDIEIFGEYQGIKKPIECHCKICDLTWAYAPRTIRENGCPRCNNSVTRKWTHQEYVDKVNELFDGNIVVLGHYENMNTKILHKCLKHDFEYEIDPAHTLRRQGCKLCGYEITSQKRTKPLNIVLSELKKKRGDEYTYVSGYVNSSTNATFRHHMPDGTYHDFQMTPNSMLSQKYNCPCCSGYQVAIGYNDFNTRRPDLSKFLVNYNDGFKHTEWSGSSVDWKCPDCGYTMSKKFAYVSKYGLTCPRCDDGYSYPNKFMYNILSQIEKTLEYLEREYRPGWCKFTYGNKDCYGRYDIYFEINDKKYIVEMDGGLGHGNRTYTNSGITQEELVFKDAEKDRLATENGFEVIRIDCDYGTNDRYDFIKGNILSSKLNELLDLSCVDFQEANLRSQKSLFMEAVGLWNIGKSVSEIKNTINVHESTVTNYLKSAKKYGICDYSAKESRTRSSANAVVCITTGREFDSIVDGANYYGIDTSNISKCCRRVSTFGGWYNGEKLIWMYKKDYDLYPKNKLSEYIPKENDNFTKVVCLNTGEIFDGIIYAAEKYGMKKCSGISSCCTGKYNSSGKDEYGKPLVWRYLSDYEKMTQEEIQQILSYKSTGKKKVICLNTLEVFGTAYLASEWCGLKNKLPIQRCCRKETKVAGVHPILNIDLSWMYYKDYIEEFGEVVKSA